MVKTYIKQLFKNIDLLHSLPQPGQLEEIKVHPPEISSMQKYLL